MKASMYEPIVTKHTREMPFYIETIGVTSYEKEIYRPNGRKSCQLLYTETGEGIVRINGKTFTAGERTLFILPPDVPHDYRAAGDTWCTCWISFGGWGAGRFFDTAAGVWELPQSFDFIKRFKKILSWKNTPEWQHKSSVLLYSLLIECREFLGEDAAAMYKLRHKLSECMKYIENNCGKTIELSELAKIGGMSEEHLCRIFKTYTGLRPFEYINGIRIQRAKEYLCINKDMTVSEIGKTLGFQSSSYFGMVFKKSTGFTPAAYRKLYR